MGIETLMLAAAVASAAGSVAGGLNSLQMSRYQARSLKAEGQQARLDAGTEVQNQLDKTAKLTGQGITAAATSGGGGEGSALSVLQDLARQSMAQARQTATQGKAAGQALDAEAKAIKRSAGVKFGLSVLNAGTSLLGSSMQMSQDQQVNSAARRVSQEQGVSRAPAGFSLEGLY